MPVRRQASAPQAGDRLDGYTPKKFLGSGTYGEVWLAENRLTRERLTGGEGS